MLTIVPANDSSCDDLQPVFGAPGIAYDLARAAVASRAIGIDFRPRSYS